MTVTASSPRSPLPAPLPAHSPHRKPSLLAAAGVARRPRPKPPRPTLKVHLPPLVAVFQRVPDQRDPRGRRHPLWAILGRFRVCVKALPGQLGRQ
jgi:hypothetical protein